MAGVAFWERLTEEMRALSYEVELWTEMPENEYRKRKGWIFSAAIRVRIWLLFPLRVLAKNVLRRHRDCTLLVATTPFYLPTLCSVVNTGSSVRIVQLLYDLYPDQLILAEKLRPATFVTHCIAAITRVSLRRCDVTVFLGERLRMSTEKRYGTARRASVIEVGGDGKLFPTELSVHRGPVRILYAGNCGYAHDTDTFLGAVGFGIPDGIEIVFHASGAGYERIRKMCIGRSVGSRLHLETPLSTAEWVTALTEADVGLVTMKAGAENVLFPSKTYSAMLAGQAVLAVCDRDSDLAKTVNGSDCGWVVEPGACAAFYAVLREIAHNRGEVDRKRRNALALARREFDMGIIARKWHALLTDL